MGNLIYLAQSVNLDLEVFRFRPGTTSALNQVVGTVVVIILIAILGALVAYIFRQRRRMRELSEQREEARLRLLLSELSLKRSEFDLLTIFAGSDQPADVIPLMESRETFEEAVVQFEQANPTAPELNLANSLRQRLEFGFHSIRNPFTNTKMLSPGIRMRCRLQLPKREVTYLTTILGVNERHFIIRPPSSKGKPVALTGLKSLQFRVSRENDGEYEFSAPIMGQQPDGMRAVRVGHTREISRMLFRNAERVEMNLPAQFYVIRHEIASERSAAGLKAHDSQYVIEGIIRDLSTGGALVVGKARQEQLHDGDMIVFRLPEAQIRDEMVTQVVGIFPQEEGNIQFHLQFQGLKELNRLKLTRFLTQLKDQERSSPAKDDFSTTAAS